MSDVLLYFPVSRFKSETGNYNPVYFFKINTGKGNSVIVLAPNFAWGKLLISSTLKMVFGYNMLVFFIMFQSLFRSSQCTVSKTTLASGIQFCLQNREFNRNLVLFHVPNSYWQLLISVSWIRFFSINSFFIVPSVVFQKRHWQPEYSFGVFSDSTLKTGT